MIISKKITERTLNMNNFKKTAIAIILASIICLSAAACQNTVDTQSSNSPEASTTDNSNTSDTSDASTSSKIDTSMTTIPGQNTDYSKDKNPFVENTSAGPLLTPVLNNINDYDFIIGLKVTSYTPENGAEINKNDIIQPDSVFYMERQGDSCNIYINRNKERYCFRQLNKTATYSYDAEKKTYKKINSQVIYDSDDMLRKFIYGLSGSMVDSDEITQNGVKYNYEKYASNGGATITNVYFDTKTKKPVRIETTIDDERHITIDVTDYDTKASEHNFNIPKDYKEEKSEENITE